MYLNGDLNQMCIQRKALNNDGFITGQEDVYPTVADEEAKMALAFLFRNKIAGWWNYEKDFIKEGVCTQEEFWEHFKNR